MYFNTRLWEFTSGFRQRILLGIFFGVLTAVAGVSRLVMSGYVVALVFQGKSFDKVVVSILGVILAIISRSVFQYFKEMTGHRTALKIQQRLRLRLFAKTLELGPAVLLRKRTGDVLLSLVEGIEILESYFGEYLPQMFVGLVTPIGLFLFMMFLDFYTALIYLIFALIDSFIIISASFTLGAKGFSTKIFFTISYTASTSLSLTHPLLPALTTGPFTFVQCMPALVPLGIFNLLLSVATLNIPL